MLHAALETYDAADSPTRAELMALLALELITAFLCAQLAMNTGDVGHADRELARLHAVAEELAQPFMRWYYMVARAKRLSISGPGEEAEAAAFAALEVGRRGGHPDSMLWFLGQIVAARFVHGTFERGDPHMPSLIAAPGESIPTSPEITPSRASPLLIGAGMSAILCEVDRFEDARGHFRVRHARRARRPAVGLPGIDDARVREHRLRATG
jgi:hypothetical protein